MTDKIRVQIYEIQRPEEAEALIDIGVDHIGSVLLEADRWKQPILADTFRVVAASSVRSSLIPLFSSADMICRALDYYRPDIVHFCETITSGPAGRRHLEAVAAVQEKVRRRFPEMDMMRSIPIGLSEENGTASLTDILTVLEPFSDWFLTDTVLPVDHQGKTVEPVTGFIGITGEVCDWEQAARLTAMTKVPVILAGGLSAENVYDGIMQVRPAGVDSCTRTNRDDGRGGYIRFEKDIGKVKKFVQEVRRAERGLERT